MDSNYSILQLKELLKSYTVAASVANATGAADDITRGAALLSQINGIRLQLALNAEMREIFYLQKNIPAAANANTRQNAYISKNDINYEFIRGIASLQNPVTLTFLNQGARAIVITRNETPWQHLFSDIQRTAPLGQQIPFDLPEPLFFGENQSLGIGVQGQTEAGYLFLHGATLKDDLSESSIVEIRREFLADNGITHYVPETQIVPIEFKFASNTAGTVGTDPNGDVNIFSLKNERSVLLTEVSTTAPDTRITITDEGKNQTFCDTVEMRGIAADQTNPFTTYYPLPQPHLLRKGDRLKIKPMNGSDISGETQDADALLYLTFRGFAI